MSDTLETRLKGGSLTLREWESLSIEEVNYPLMKAGISPSKEEGMNEVNVHEYYGYHIKANHYVGSVGFDPAIEIAATEGPLSQIIITPKIKTSDFLRMFAIAYNLELPVLKDPSQLDDIEDVRLILALLYIQAVEELFKKYLRRNYVIRVERLQSRIKGKLLIGDYIRGSVARGQPQVAVCQFYELTPDTLLNRIIKAGLRISRQLVQYTPEFVAYSTLSGKAAKLIGMMAHVEAVRVTPTDFAKVRIHSQNRHYLPALTIARLLVTSKRFDYEYGGRSVRGFFIDMNDLFERFIAGLLKQGAYRDDVTYQDKGEFSYYYGNRDTKGTVKLKPDITIDTDGEKVVIDAKYKELFEDNIRGEEEIETGDDYGDINVKIRSSDIYQLVAYMDNFGSRRGVLVYPRNGTETSIINVDGFGDKDIKILGVGLSYEEDLTKKGTELEEKLLKA